MINWSAHHISNETLRVLFKNGFTSRSAIAQIRESDLRYLRKHTDISPGQIVLLRGVIENISKEEKEVKVAETQTTSSEQETHSTDDAYGNHKNVSSENEQISDQENIPVSIQLSNSQNNGGTLDVNLPDRSMEHAVRLPRMTQNASESIPVSNQPLVMSGIEASEQTDRESAQTTIESSNFTIPTQSHLASTFSPKEIAIAEIISQLTSNPNIPSDQNNAAFQHSFTTTSAHAAERNGGFRSRLELAQIDPVNEAQRWNPIFPGKNKICLSVKIT